jgi:hypothetical protein
MKILSLLLIFINTTSLLLGDSPHPVEALSVVHAEQKIHLVKTDESDLLHYSSSFPVYRIRNDSDSDVLLTENQILLSPGEECEMGEFPLLDIECQTAGEEIHLHLEGVDLGIAQNEAQLVYPQYEWKLSHKGYTKSPFVSEDIWGKVQPYLLPLDHPAKSFLDKVCSKRRILESDDALKKAGFLFRPNSTRTGMIVARHMEMWGYLIKTHLDTKDVQNRDASIWMHRVDGANLIRECIKAHGYEHLLKTPRKWLYPVPPDSTSGRYRQNFMLVVEDMHILEHSKNKDAFKKKMNIEKMDALVTVMKECRLNDCVYVFNIPFSHDGRIAFVDTEHFNIKSRPIKFFKLTPYFSSKMQKHWKKLTD